MYYKFGYKNYNKNIKKIQTLFTKPLSDYIFLYIIHLS